MMRTLRLSFATFLVFLAAGLFVSCRNAGSSSSISSAEYFNLDPGPSAEVVVDDNSGEIVGLLTNEVADTYYVFNGTDFTLDMKGYHKRTLSAASGEGFLSPVTSVSIDLFDLPGDESAAMSIELNANDGSSVFPCLGYENSRYKIEVDGRHFYVSSTSFFWYPISF